MDYLSISPQLNKVQNYQRQVFRGTTYPQTAQNVTSPNLIQIPQDTVEISAEEEIKKKSGLSKGAKVGLTVTGVLGGIVTAGVLISKHQTGKLKKLYAEKMQLVNLPEKIDFKEAKTVEEGIKFAKDVLKVGEVDKNFTLDAINFANRGLVDVSNAQKGKLFIPKKLHYTDAGEKWVACVIQDIESKSFGEMFINSKYFDEKFLNESLTKLLGVEKKTGAAAAKTAEKEAESAFTFVGNYDQKIKDLASRFRKSPDSLSIKEKRDLRYSLQGALSIGDALMNRAPLSTLKNNIKLFEQYGIKVDIDDFAKLSTEKQSDKLHELFKQVKEKSKTDLIIDIPFVTPESVIYHEMGHLQDFAKNLKELDIKQWKIPSFKEAFKNAKEGKKDDSSVMHVANRWGGLTYKGYKDLFLKNPEKFKKRYPDLYEFLTNQESQQAAGRISAYAQTSIGEFIAEVYAKMVRGDKIPDEVMKLYKKYNGPTF